METFLKTFFILLVLWLLVLMWADGAYASTEIRAGAGWDGQNLNYRTGPMVGAWIAPDDCVDCLAFDAGAMAGGLEGQNFFAGADYTHQWNEFSATVGGAYLARPLNETGKNLNFHLGLGLRLTDRVALYLDHWSNGRRYFHPEQPKARNIPRNLIDLGISF